MKIENKILLKKEYDSSVHDMIKLTKADKSMIELEMRLYAKKFLKDNFNIDLMIPIKIDGRLTRAGGSFHYYDSETKRKSDMIKVSERYVACAFHDKEDGVEAILDVLRHELVHYALFEKKKGHKDGELDFENKLAELGIGSSGATSEDKRLSKTPNVWYKILDIYLDSSTDTEYEYNHTKKSQNWIGERVGVRIVKSIF